MCRIIPHRYIHYFYRFSIRTDAIAKFKIDGMYDMFRAWKTFVGTALEHADLT